MEKIEVKNCCDCVFLEHSTLKGQHCSRTNIKIYEVFNAPPPDSCPLRKSSITITLKSK